jgi:tetratricopeptide (TPR) repeat protein
MARNQSRSAFRYVSAVVSFALGTAGRAQEAVTYGKTAVEQDPSSFIARWTLQVAYRWNGQYEEALAVLETFWAESPMTWVAIHLVPTYAKLGRLEQARAIYDQLLARRDREYVPPFALAVCASGARGPRSGHRVLSFGRGGSGRVAGPVPVVDTRPGCPARRSPLCPPGRAVQRAEALIVGSRLRRP